MWQPIETAPKGHITENVGCRSHSEWFRARVFEKYRAANPGMFIIRRRSWPQDDNWEDRDGTTFVPEFFDAWQPHANL